MKYPRPKRVFHICIFMELLLLLLCTAIALFRENKVYTLRSTDFVREDGAINSVPIVLPRGVYRVALEYTCEGTMRHFCTVESPNDPEGLLCSGEHLSDTRGITDFDLWVKGGGTTALVRIQCGEGPLSVQGLSICQTSRDMSRMICMLLALFLMADGFYLYRLRGQESRVTISRSISLFKGTLSGANRPDSGVPGKKSSADTTVINELSVEQQSAEKRMIFWGLCAIIACSSIPLLARSIYPGSDITYHLLRIGNIKDGLLDGQFPVRIDPSWLYGHGYASSVCYGDIFLYLPAVLRILGFTLQESYVCFLFLLNVATCLISYYSFRRVFQDRRVGLLCSAAYTLSVYRLFKMYSWGALGEAQSMVFLPLIFCSVYLIFTEDPKDRMYGRLWIPLGLGFAGIIQCHILTVEICVLFLAAACLVLWKRLCRPGTLLVFVKGVLWTTTLSAWFVIPFLDYYFNVDMIIHHVSARTIQEAGLYPANLLFAFFLRGSSRDFMASGMRDMEALGIGLPLSAAAMILVFLWFFGYMKQKSGLISAAKLAVILACLSMLMSLSCFPWTRIQFLNGITEKLVSSIQYPNRFLMIGTLLLTFILGVCIVIVKGAFGEKARFGTMAAFYALILVTAFFYQSSIVQDGGTLVLYDEKGLGTGYLSGAEYLRYGIQQPDLSFHAPLPGDDIEILEYEKTGLEVNLLLKNSGNDSYVEVPLQHYKGYTALSADGEELKLEDGTHCDIRVLIPAGFEGELTVRFHPPWYWRMGELISLLSLLGIIAFSLHGKFPGSHLSHDTGIPC